MRLVYTADLHGSLPLYRELGEAAVRWEADAVIIGGDLCPASRPFENQPQAHADFIHRDFAPLIAGWKRERPPLRVLVIPGNDDFQTIVPALDALEEEGLLENLHRKAAKLGTYTLMGLAFVPPTPFSIKDFERRDLVQPAGQPIQLFRSVVGSAHGAQELADFRTYLNSHESIEEELDRLDGLVQENSAKLIAVIHAPPKNSRCDVLSTGQHIGSEAVRRWIERRQPQLTLHGHIHESPRMSKAFADRIGASRTVNPGCDRRTPHLVLIDLENLDEMTHSVYSRRKP